ncbi:MAG: hypothetical protein ACI9UT_001580, partial [Flavobacteriales bacterium]
RFVESNYDDCPVNLTKWPTPSNQMHGKSI